MIRFVLLSCLFLSFGLAAEDTKLSMDALNVRSNIIAELFILVGCFFILAAGIGMFRFPDFYTRLHASSKLVTLGGLGIFLGAAIAFIPVAATQRVILTAIFFLITTPLAGYMIARAGYLQGLVPYKESSSVDEWQALGKGDES